jgi:hypothetical protein
MNNEQPAVQPYDKKAKKEGKKKGKGKFVFLGIIILVIGIAVGVSQGGSDSSNDSGSGKDSKDSKATTASLNESVRDGKMEFVVKSFNCDQSTIGGEYAKTDTTGKFCIADVSIKNISDKPVYLSSSDQKLFSVDEKEYAVDTEASIYLEDNSVIFDELNPDVLLEGKLVFDVPKELEVSHLELHDSPFSGGVKVNLK